MRGKCKIPFAVCQLYAGCLTNISQQSGEDRDISSTVLVRKERGSPCLGAHKGKFKEYMNVYREKPYILILDNL